MRRDQLPRGNLSNWRSVRRWESATREQLQRHHALWLHGWCIGLLVMLTMWAVAHLQMLAGSGSLAVRYAATLGAGYIVFLLLLRWWAGQLVGEDTHLDAPSVDFGGGGGGGHVQPAVQAPEPSAAFGGGGGGDFAGGGAQGSFEVDAQAGDAIREVAGKALEAAGSADEGAVVVIPVVVVFLAGLLVVLGAGSLLMLYFGWEVLLAVAVEIAFGYVSARTAVKVVRQGWLPAAVRLTWKPLLGALACAVLLGVLLDAFVPQARSLPQAVKLMRAK